MAKRMLVDATHPEETRVVVVSGNKLEELDFEIASRKQLKGNIYLAKVTRVEPSLQAAFVEYGGNRHGFLAFSEIHPDYYRIPVADREALLAQERAEAERQEQAEEGRYRDEGRVSFRDEQRGGGRRRRGDRGRRRDEGAASGENPEENNEESFAEGGGDDGGSVEFVSYDALDPSAEIAHDAPVDGAVEAASRVVEDVNGVVEEVPAGTGEVEPVEPKAPTYEAEATSTQEEASPPPAGAADQKPEDEGHNGEKPEGGSMAAEYRPEERSEPWAPAEAPADVPAEAEAPAPVPQPTPAPTWAEHAVRDAHVEHDVSPGLSTGFHELGAHAGAETPAAADEAEAALDETPADETADDADEEAEESGDNRPRRPRSIRSYKIQEVIKRRQILLVQVVKEERGNKGAALTTYLSLPGRYCVLMPNTGRGGGISRKITNPQDRKRLKEMLSDLDIPEGMAVILRTAGMERSKPEIKRDLEYLLRLWDSIRDLTLKSTAPALIYEEANLIKRSIRDLYSDDFDEVLVEGESGHRMAKDFMRMLMPSHTGKIQQYKDETIPLYFRYQVEAQIDAIHSPVVQLRSGGYIVINQTEALVAIDVNSGRSTKERNIEETAFKTNLEAAEEVARQLRLRDLAGLIVIDFIDMEDARNNAAVERRLKEAMKNDRARIQLGRISPFGLLELSRQRLRPSLIETNFERCPHCHGTGMIRSLESAALYVLRAIEEEGIRKRSSEITVHVATRIALYILNQKRDALGEIERRYGFRVFLFGDDELTPPEFRLERIKARTAEEAQPTISTERILAETDRALEREAVEDEEDESAEANGEEAAENGSAAQGEDAQGERRGRRRRRRRGRRDERGEVRSDQSSAEQGEANGDEEGDDSDAEEGEEDAERADQPFAESSADAESRKRRRRGKRGGRRRRNREFEDGQAEGVAVGDEAQDATGSEDDDFDEDAPAPSEPEEPRAAAARTVPPAILHDDIGDIFADIYVGPAQDPEPAPAPVEADAPTPAPEPAAAEAPVEVPAEAPAEAPAKPKRKAPARKKKAEAEAAPVEAAPVEAAREPPPAAEEPPAKPKRKAPARKKADAAPSPEPVAEAPTEAAAEAPTEAAAEPTAETPEEPRAPQASAAYEVIRDAPKPEKPKRGWWNKLIG